MMKKAKWLWMFLILCCLNVGLDAGAQGRILTAEWTEADRYNPKYNMPILPATGKEQLDQAGISDAQLQELENVLVTAWKNRETSVDVSKFDLTISDGAWSDAYWQIRDNHPEVFYVGNALNGVSNGNYMKTLLISYSMEKAESDAIEAKMNAAVNEALALVSDDMEDYEKALVIHDWLVNYCRYDEENYKANTIPASSYQAYGALAYGVAVCDGYAKAYQYIMNYKLGIACYHIGSSTMKHAWNMIEMDGKYYHVDVTWDDPISDRIGGVQHNNFLLSDAGIAATGHSGWEIPVTATDTRFDSRGNWHNTSGQIIGYRGNWYYADDKEKAIVTTTDIFDGTTTSLYSLGTWKAGAHSSWGGAFTYPQFYDKKLVFNGPKKIYCMRLSDRQVKEIYAPSMPEDTEDTIYNIFGFDIKNGKLRYVVSSSANLTGEETVYEADYPSLGTVAGTVTILGNARYGDTLSAQVSLASGISGEASIQWYRQGNVIPGATEASYRLTGADVGKEIGVEVTVENYFGELTAVTDKVQKAIVSAPGESVSVTGERGQKLSSISLPKGYFWENPDTVMTDIGAKTYGIVYCPEEEIYQPLTGLTATVTVVCKNHEWDEGTIVKSATTTETGIRKYRCQYCTAAKEEEIPILSNPGDKGENSGNTEQSPGEKGENSGNEITLKKGFTFTDSKTGNQYKITKVTKTKAEAAFAGTAEKKKKTIVIPATVKYAGRTISVTSVAKNALKNNQSVTKVTVGKNVTSIGASAFYGCKKLKTITIKSTIVKSFGKNCVKNIYKQATIKCPKSSKEKYSARLTKKTGFTKQMEIK